MKDDGQRRDDFERGLAMRRATLGEDWVRRSTEGATAFTAEFQDFITRYAWQDVWTRPGLPHQTRRLLVLGMTMGLARWEEFELHCRAAIRGGVPVEAIKETLLQGAIYCGVPAANTAFKLTQQILVQEGLAPLPEPLSPERRPSRQQTFSSPQLSLVLQGEGERIPLVFSHALGLDLHLWDGCATHFAALGHPTLRYDQRGHGRSARPAGPCSLDQLVQDAIRLIEEWGRGPVVFVGLSLGGMVGQGLALARPDLLKGLVLAHTTAQYPPEAQAAWAQRIAAVEAGGMAAVVEQIVDRYLGADASLSELREGLRATLLAQDPQAYMAAAHAVCSVDYLGRLAALRCPTLVIAGGRDPGATPAMAEAMAGRIARARLALLPAVAHLGVMEDPEAFEALLGEFVSSLS
ncbi:alpha/beta fold hydrolase [Pelomonas sp. SE-A7]|uniref:bifunctional 4-carboxymuconolactone decarboxylase/3-oxoadipate enol-lactonase PcaCD n=1 Tax=Pelomonas sp. SE-A7 TaxID=3054953 RepID=UPI00259CCF07|nr:alpha/beta fold hydrolase [Pelomonas sp. SE-A7]MDM4767336.1 alpha/beta fold hydrolase [Pelomonas sp. SE-A7]